MQAQARPNARSRPSRPTMPLLPAAQARMAIYQLPLIPTKAFLRWTFGRDTVIWRIWPAVALHTIFAGIVVAVSLETNIALSIPPVLLTVLGVVIGFVISYRAMSGYDRYWMGRIAWSDIVKNSRTLSRLIWFHVPLRIKPVTTNAPLDLDADEVAKQVMAEKRQALNLIEAFAVATKHHLRGERGVYYEDLYHLVSNVHQRSKKHHGHHRHAKAIQVPVGVPHMTLPEGVDTIPDLPDDTPILVTLSSPQSTIKPLPEAEVPIASLGRMEECDPVIPPINSYGTFDPHAPHRLNPPLRHATSSSSMTSCSSNGPRILRPGEAHVDHDNHPLLSSAQVDYIPFNAFWRGIWSVLSWPFRGRIRITRDAEEGHVTTDGNTEQQTGQNGEGQEWDSDDDEDDHHDSDGGYGGETGGVQRRWGRGHADSVMPGGRFRPRVLGGGENMPLEVARSLSSWMAVLEERGTVPGTSLGSMIAAVSSLEDNLSTLERILTTPLPFVYSVHIRHTVWIYLAFLPFQLIEQFKWYTIPGVAMAAFIYLGFVAAGEEIEQPFGYDENDLDLDMFCRDLIHADIERLQRTPATHAFLGAQSVPPVMASKLPTVQDVFSRIGSLQ